MAISKEKNKEKEIEKIKNPGKTSQEKKKTKLLITIILVILIILALFLSVIFALVQKSKNTIVKGVSAKGVDLSNLTIADAKSKVITQINNETKDPIKLKYNDYSLDINLSEIEFAYDVDATLKEAYEIGRTDDIIKSNYSILFTILKGKELDLKYKYNEDALNKIIENIDTDIPGRTSEYTYCVEDDELIITSGVDGIVVKTDELKSMILDTILNGKLSNKEINIPTQNKPADKIDIEKIYKEIYCEPKDAILIEEPFELIKDEDGIDFAITMEEAKALITGDKEEYTIPLKITKAEKNITNLGAKAFPHILSEFKTYYNQGATARTKNLQIAAEKINGTVLMPGEEFSFNKVVGKRTVQDGYQNAPVYENGKVVDGIAGGICQISTTLYNAALLANLEITDRRNHNFTSTYADPGRDATVVYGSQDFKFRNTRQFPIQLNCSVSGGVASFEIKGIKEETEYDVKILTNVTATIPFTEEIEEDKSLAPGTKSVAQAGHNGAKVTSYRVLYLNGNEVSRTLLYNDTYRAMNRIVKVAAGTSNAQEQNPNVPEDIVVTDVTQNPEPTSQEEINNENSQASIEPVIPEQPVATEPEQPAVIAPEAEPTPEPEQAPVPETVSTPEPNTANDASITNMPAESVDSTEN